MPNELKPGTRRTGDLFDFDPKTPPVKVVLERTEQGISVEVPWSGPDDYYASWFLEGNLLGNQIKPRPAPKRLLFVDSYGAVQLVGCWARGYHTNLATGTGRVWAQFAVMDVDVDVDFLQVNGLQSEVSGLREWLGVSSVWEDLDGPTRSLAIVAKSADEIVISPALTFVPTWALERPESGTTLVRDFVACRTESESPLSWGEITSTHLGIRDLMVLTRWRPEISIPSIATRYDDPLITMDGTDHGRQWRIVVPARGEEPPSAPGGYRPYLMEFGEIGGAQGVARWLHLRDEFSRALDPIISDRYLQQVPAVTHLAQVGPGLEALGYLLLKNRDGVGSQSAKDSSLRTRLDRIAADIDGAVPFDVAIWAEEMTRVYNGIKHANRQLPAELSLLNCWRESVVAIRAWVALELGTPAAAAKRRLELDPSAARFVERP